MDPLITGLTVHIILFYSNVILRSIADKICTSPYLFEWCCWAIQFSLPLVHWVIIVTFITPDWLINVLFTDSKWTFRRHWCSRGNYSKGKRELVLNDRKYYNYLTLLCLNVAGNLELVKAYIIWPLNNNC